MATSTSASEAADQAGPISPPGSISTVGRRRESLVWEYFNFDSAKGRSECQVEKSGTKCNASIAGKFPTNLKAHLKGNHPAAYEDLLKREAERQKK